MKLQENICLAVYTASMSEVSAYQHKIIASFNPEHAAIP